MKRSIIFKDLLGVFPEKPELEAKLISDSLVWQKNGKELQLSLDDVVGVSVLDSKESEFPGLLLHVYPIDKTDKKQSRSLKEYYFTCPTVEARSQWHRAIANTLMGKEIDAPLKPRQLQVIINPTSGKKQAAQIFANIRPLFDRSFLKYTVRESHSSQDIQDFVRHLDLSEIDGLVIVGGDGTIHDAIAGLTSRPDWQQAIALPLGIIPGGTGNGLSKSLLELSGENYDPLNAAFLIAKGKQQSFDLAAVKQSDRNYFSFLSLAWGLISDADIKSEKLKFLGALRFDLYALFLICLLRTYKGKFSFIPHPDCQAISSSKIQKQGEWCVIEDEFIFLWAMNTPWAASDMNVTPYARLDDGAIDVLVMRKGTSRWELLKALLRCGKGEHLDLPHMEYYKVRSFRLEPLTKKGLLVVDGELVDYSPIEMEIIPNLACVNG